MTAISTAARAPMVSRIAAPGGDDKSATAPHPSAPEPCTETLTVKVPLRLHEAVKDYAARLRIPYSVLIREVIEAHLVAVSQPKKKAGRAARPSASSAVWRKKDGIVR